MSESYLFATNKGLDQDTIVWSNQISPANTLNFSTSLTESLNDTYVTAIDCSDSQYLSVLENTAEHTLEDLNLTLSNSKLVDNVELNSEFTSVNIGEIGDQVVVFTVEGSDELYGLQVLLDEHGNSQKYQFKLRQNENGQLEAIPETIQLLNDSDVTLEQQDEVLAQEFQPDEVESDATVHSQDISGQGFAKFIKGEPNEVIQQEDQECEEPNEDIDVKPALLEIQQGITNMKSEIYQEENTQEIYEQGQPTHIMFQEESNVEIFNQNVPDEIYNQDELNQEIFSSNTAHNGIYHTEDSDHTETLSNQTEETLIQEDRNFYEENSEEVQTFEAIQFNNDQMVLETQFLPEVDDHESTDTHEEFPQYEKIYLQTDDQHLDLNEETVFNTESETSEDYNQQHNNKNENFQIIERVDITAEKQDLNASYKDSPLFHPSPPTVLKKPAQNNILKQQSASKLPKKSKKVLCYVVQHPEKENVNSIPPVMSKTYKTNPRSVLKQSAIDGSLIDSTSQALKHKDQHLLEKAKLERRFAKNKDAIQAKLFNNFLSKTTIPHAPIRQKRLPRKQEIKPVDTRTEEEIIVQEVMVSSNGFIESVEERLNGKEKLEVVGYIDLSDSEDENSKINQKKSGKSDNVIEILSSEDESERNESANKPSETPKKRRGRPRKTPETMQSPQKEDNGVSANEKACDSADESSPSKKTRTDDDSTEVESDTSKREFNCPLCSKTFPSPNSLSTHIQHHKLENSMHKPRTSTFEFKHKCLNCNSTYKNSILLNRHDCPKKNKKGNKSHQCSICKKSFDSLISLNLHKQSHSDEGATNTFSRPSAVAKRLTLDTKKAPKGMTEIVDNKKKETARKAPSRPSILPKKITEEPADGSNKYQCETCDQTFKNGILLKKHVCNSDKNNQQICKTCNMAFKTVTLLNLHKRKHIKENMVMTTSEVQISPMKFLPSGSKNLKKSPKKTLSHLKVVNKASPSFKMFLFSYDKSIDSYMMVLQPLAYWLVEYLNGAYQNCWIGPVEPQFWHLKSLVYVTRIEKIEQLRNIIFERCEILHHNTHGILERARYSMRKRAEACIEAVLKKFSCASCNSKFTSKVLLDIHTRKSCVKTSVNKRTSRRISFGKSIPNQNLTIMSSLPLDMHAQCDACPKKFKSYKVLIKHQITEHGYSPPNKQELMNPQKKGLREHTGIPANPRLQKSFAALMTQLQHVTPRKADYQPDKI